ncbi:MAG TPA: hypothetical protein P5134_07295 [Bacteroidales bacterium]|nr:hypothetical protein [Bacteroidales bacterium]HRT14396.1 hypothetical protein [Bacteroidales bacterium]
MKFHELNHRPDDENLKLNEIFSQFRQLLAELENREIPDEIVTSINNDIDEINSITVIGNELQKEIERRLQRIIKLLEKNLKLVPKNYYRNLWMILGIAVFGIPIGVILGASLDNMAYLAIGLPIGLVIGIGVGAVMDQKALKKGRQLDIEIK